MRRVWLEFGEVLALQFYSKRANQNRTELGNYLGNYLGNRLINQNWTEISNQIPESERVLLLRYISQEKLTSRVNPNDKRKRQILLSSLPKNLQELRKELRAKKDCQKVIRDSISVSSESLTESENLTRLIKKIYKTKISKIKEENKAQVVKLCAEFVKVRGIGKVKGILEFMEIWNEAHSEKFRIGSRNSIHTWTKQYSKDGKKALSGNYKNMARHVAEFSEEAKAYIKKLHYEDSKLSIYHCYENLLYVAQLKGWKVPSYATVKRFLYSLPLSERIYFREGEKAFLDQIYPSIDRDISTLRPGELYVMDDRVLDISHNTGRKGERLWVTAIMDVRTKRIMALAFPEKESFSEKESPDAQSVLDAVYFASLEHISEYIYMDNGANYKKAGHKSKESELPKEVKAPLEWVYGSKIYWAKVRNARTKLIERRFSDLADKFDKTFESYTGKNTLERPESWAEKRKRGVFPTRDEVAEELKEYIFEKMNNWKTKKSGKSPNQMWSEYFSTNNKRRVKDTRELRMALLTVHSEELQVQPRGFWFKKDYKDKGCWYFENWVMDLPRGEKFVIKYNSNDLSKIYVGTVKKGKFVELGSVGKFRHQGYDYLHESRKNLQEYQDERKSKIEEMEAVRDGLDEIHGVEITRQLKRERTDYLPEPDFEVDENTGEIIENVEVVELGNELPPNRKKEEKENKKSLQKAQKELSESLNKNQTLAEKRQTDSDGTKKAFEELKQVLNY